MKHIWHAVMMFHCFVTFPAMFIFFIYSFGAMVLIGQWQLFLWGVVAFVGGAVAMATLAIMSE